MYFLRWIEISDINQQNLLKNRIALLRVMAKSNNIRSIVPLVPEIAKALGFIKPGELVIVGP